MWDSSAFLRSMYCIVSVKIRRIDLRSRLHWFANPFLLYKPASSCFKRTLTLAYLTRAVTTAAVRSGANFKSGSGTWLFSVVLIIVTNPSTSVVRAESGFTIQTTIQEYSRHLVSSIFLGWIRRSLTTESSIEVFIIMTGRFPYNRDISSLKIWEIHCPNQRSQSLVWQQRRELVRLDPMQRRAGQWTGTFRRMGQYFAKRMFEFRRQWAHKDSTAWEDFFTNISWRMPALWLGAVELPTWI